MLDRGELESTTDNSPCTASAAASLTIGTTLHRALALSRHAVDSRVMAREDASTYRLRRFRVAMAAFVALPWVLRVLLAPFFGWHMSLARTAFGLALDGLLVSFAWRNPSGIASILITLRLIGGAAVGFWWGGGVAVSVSSVLLCAEGVLLVWLLAPMWLGLRRDRRQAQLARVDAMTLRPDRRALKRQAKIDKRGYL
jgi:hypothetical protein